MRLCLIAPFPPPNGGVANWTRIITSEIRRHQEISLDVINIASNKRITDGRTLFDRVFYGIYIMFKAFFCLIRQIRLKRPDVVHITTSGGMGFYRDLLLLKYLEMKNIPSVYHIHFGRTVEYKRLENRNWKLLLKAVKLAKSIITIDLKTYEILQKYSNRTHYINNPIDISVFSNYDIIEKREICFIGWVIKEKGIEDLIQAFVAFNQSHSRLYTLKLIGPVDKNYLFYLRNTYNTENIEFCGEMEHEDAMKVLARCMLFVLPSYTEGFPNVILEAMILKKAIIATNVGAIPEMLKENAGILVEPGNKKDLYEKMTKVLDNKKTMRELSKCAYERVKKYYNIHETYSKYEKIWKQLIY